MSVQLRGSDELAARWRAWEPKARATGYRWGLPWLDEALPSPQPGTLTVVGGRTGVGKSFFTLSMLHGAAARGERPVVYASFEEPELEVGRRAAAGLGHSRLLACCPERALLSSALDVIDEAGKLGAGWVLIDYAQLLGYDGPIQVWSKADSVSRLVAELKSAAKRAGVPLLVVSQLRRPTQAEGEAFPSIFQLKESGDIENMAEYIILLGGGAKSVRVEVCKAKSAPVGAFQRYARGRGGVLEPVRGREGDEP